MAANNTSASTTISFAVVNPDGSSSAIEVQLDEEASGNKSSFAPGDSVYFLVHTNPQSLTVTVDTTMGTVSANGTKSVPVSDDLQYVKSKSATLSRIPNGSVTTAWIGRAGGARTISGREVSVPAEVNGILHCTYNTTAKSYKLSGVTIPPGATETQVLVVVSAAE